MIQQYNNFMEDADECDGHLSIKFKFRKGIAPRRFTFAAENDATQHRRLSPNGIDEKSPFEGTLSGTNESGQRIYDNPP